MVKDIPIPDNQSIIIFSATGGGEGGRVRQNISFAHDTALTLTGGIETDFVRITPSGSSFVAVAKFHKATGEATFSCTATTEGDEEAKIAGVTASFSFRVLVLGVDFPHLVQGFFEFPVGAAVNQGLNIFYAAAEVQLNIPKTQSAIVSQTYGELESYTDSGHGDITRQRWIGEPSGVSLDPTLDAQNVVRGASLTGVAVRPGIYYRTFAISSYDNSGAYDPFPGANGWAILILNIYDDRESPKLIVPHTHTADPDALRVIRHDLEGYTAARLTGDFIRSGEVWTRRVEEVVSAQVSDVWEYRMESASGVWTLSGRNYLSDETVPDYSTLAMAPERFGEVPPNVGWTGGVLCAGDYAFFVEGHGFFDWKGARTIEEHESSVYEQQPVVAAQYEGWSNPPATQYADGLYLAPDPAGVWRVSADPLATNGDEVETQTIRHAAIPYHPPTAAPTIAGVQYRDAALLIEREGLNLLAVNAHLPTAANLAFRQGNRVAGVPSHYTWLRQLPPPMEIGSQKKIVVDVAIEQSTPPAFATYSDQYECLKSIETGPNESEVKGWSFRHGEKKITQSFKATIPTDTWMRSQPDLISGMIGMVVGDSSAMTYEMRGFDERTYGSSTKNTQVDPGFGSLETHSNETRTELPTGVSGDQFGRVLMSFASGRNEDTDTVGLYAAGLADASGSMQTESERVYYRDQTHVDYATGEETESVLDDSTTTDGPFTRSMAAGMVSPMCHRVSMADLIFDGLTKETVTASFEGVLQKSSSWYDGAWHTVEDYSEEVEATHEHTCYTGDNLPAAVVDTGWTHVKQTINGVVSDTWYSDPNGVVYRGLYADYGDEFDWGALELPETGTRNKASRYTMRNETYTKRTESFHTEA